MIPPYSYRAQARRRRRRRLVRTALMAACLLVVVLVVIPRLFGGPAPKAVVSVGRSPSPHPSVRVSPTPSPSVSVTVAPPPSLRITALPRGLPAALSRAQSLPDGAGLLILGGLSGANSSPLVQRFDPVSGTVTPNGRLATASHDAAAAQLGTTDFLFGGGEAKTIDDVQVYASATSTVIAHLPQARSDLVATVVGGKIYLLGGFDGKTDQPDVLVTTDGIHYQFLTTLPTPVRYAGVGVIGSTIYLVGGEHNGVQTTQIQAIDVNTGSARVVANLQAALSHESVFTLRGSLFFAGGRTAATTRNQVDALDPATGAVTRAGLLPQPISDAALGQIGDDVYLFGGESPVPLRGIVHIAVAQ